MLGQSQKRGRCEAVNGCWVVTPRTDQQVSVLRLESPAPTLSAKGAEKGGAPRSFGIPTLKNVSLLVAGRFVHGAALHYEIYVLEGADVCQGIGLNSDDVGVFTWLERTNVGGASD